MISSHIFDRKKQDYQVNKIKQRVKIHRSDGQLEDFNNRGIKGKKDRKNNH